MRFSHALQVWDIHAVSVTVNVVCKKKSRHLFYNVHVLLYLCTNV